MILLVSLSYFLMLLLPLTCLDRRGGGLYDDGSVFLFVQTAVSQNLMSIPIISLNVNLGESAEAAPPRHRKPSGSSTGSGGGANFNSSLLGRTVMIVTIISVAMQAVYSLCHDDITVKVIIYVPKNTKISKLAFVATSQNVYYHCPVYGQP